MAQEPLQHGSGQVIDGRYRLERVLGHGGMGTVWLARHEKLHRRVALKLLRARTERATERFLREARAAAAVRHVNVVDITDFGVSAEGEPYMVMELLEGVTLAQRLEASPPLPVAELLVLVDATLSGLDAIHRNGLVHRDLKPENIFLVDGANGPVPKVVDFGLSAPAPGADNPMASAVLTLEGEILGTPSYMSPEQVRKLDDIDARADVYSLGVLLYAALTGELPYDAPNMMDVLLLIASDAEAEPIETLRPEVNAELAALVRRAMAKDRADRFADVRSLRSALRSLPNEARSSSLDARPVTRKTRRSGAIGVPVSARRAPIANLVFSEPEISVLRDPGPDRTSHPPAFQPVRRLWLVAALALAACAVVAASLTVGSSDSMRASSGADALTSAGGSELGVSVLLRGVPDTARIEVDGRVVDGPRFRHARDLRAHEVTISAEGFEPWRSEFVADGDVDVRVELRPDRRAVRRRAARPTPAVDDPNEVVDPEQPIEAVVEPEPPPMVSARRPREPEIFTELDY